VVTLKEAGSPDSDVIAAIQRDQNAFDISVQGVQRLDGAGLSTAGFGAVVDAARLPNAWRP
jgi:hypothetical protein